MGAAAVVPPPADQIERELAVAQDLGAEFVGQHSSQPRRLLFDDAVYHMLLDSVDTPFFYNVATGMSSYKRPPGFEPMLQPFDSGLPPTTVAPQE